MNNNISGEFLKTLMKKYKEEKIKEEVIKAEIPILQRVLETIALSDSFKDIFEIVDPIGVGGAGVVIKVKDKRLNWDRALKIPRPKEDNLIPKQARFDNLTYLTIV